MQMTGCMRASTWLHRAVCRPDRPSCSKNADGGSVSLQHYREAGLLEGSMRYFFMQNIEENAKFDVNIYSNGRYTFRSASVGYKYHNENDVACSL